MCLYVDRTPSTCICLNLMAEKLLLSHCQLPPVLTAQLTWRAHRLVIICPLAHTQRHVPMAASLQI